MKPREADSNRGAATSPGTDQTPGSIFWREGVTPVPPGTATQFITRLVGRLYLVASQWTERLTARVRGPARPVRPAGSMRILAVGPFYSENWVAAHLHALGRTPEVQDIRVITPEAYRPLPGVRYHIPPAWLRRLCGMSVARACSALRLVFSERPDVVIGYHAPWNGVVSLLAGRLGKCRTAYFSVGGPAEIIGGGLYSEHALFRRIGKEIPDLERRFLALIDRFDSIITMGSGSAQWFRSAGISASIWPMGASVDGSAFSLNSASTGGTEKTWDFVTVARLAPIKRLDLLIRAVAELRDQGEARKAVIVGDGADRSRLETLLEETRLAGSVELAGFQSNVESWLERSRLFVMTSASEGLPLAIIEAMLCGLPVVAPAVGDIPDLIVDGRNGFLFEPGDVGSCVEALRRAQAVGDTGAMGRIAREHALAYTIEGRVPLWSEWLASQRVADTA